MERIVLLRLAGGLGNQIFQLGFAMDYVSRNNCKLLVSKSHINNYDVVHEYVLEDIFELESIISSNRIIDFILKLRLPRLFPLLASYVSFVSDKNVEKLIKSDFHSSKLLIIDGYFQKIYKNIDYSFLKNRVRKEYCKNTDFDVSIHVRGGDFLKLNYTSKDIENFYREAIIELKKIFTKYRELRIAVVTDDRNFVNKIPSLQGFEILDRGVVDDFALLLNSKIQVYASSTFAISAALLSDKRKVKLSTCVWMDGLRRDPMENEKCIKT